MHISCVCSPAAGYNLHGSDPDHPRVLQKWAGSCCEGTGPVPRLPFQCPPRLSLGHGEAWWCRDLCRAGTSDSSKTGRSTEFRGPHPAPKARDRQFPPSMGAVALVLHEQYQNVHLSFVVCPCLLVSHRYLVTASAQALLRGRNKNVCMCWQTFIYVSGLGTERVNTL